MPPFRPLPNLGCIWRGWDYNLPIFYSITSVCYKIQNLFNTSMGYACTYNFANCNNSSLITWSDCSETLSVNMFFQSKDLTKVFKKGTQAIYFFNQNLGIGKRNIDSLTRFHLWSFTFKFIYQYYSLPNTN